IFQEIGKSADFLETEQHNVPSRQRSIRSVFDYSWNLLSDDERTLFACLSVFRGGFTREAAEQVAGASLRTLAGLVNKSMLRRDPNGRYEIHDLLRQYANSHLVQVTTDYHIVESRYVTYYLDLVHRQDSLLKGNGQKEALDVIETEIDNVRMAWRY